MSFQEVVDENIAERIVYWMGGPYFALDLRMVSRRCAAIIPPPPRVRRLTDIAAIAATIGDLQRCEKILREGVTSDDLIYAMAIYAARYNRCDICRYTTDALMRCYEFILREAAFRGNRELCDQTIDRMIRSDAWKGMELSKRESYFSHMMNGAATGGYIALVELAGKSCEKHAHAIPDLKYAMRGAAEAGHDDICKLLHSWSSAAGQIVNPEEVLYFAARGNHKSTCELAKSWGARDFMHVFTEGANEGSVEACVLARDWLDAAGKIDLNVLREMITSAIHGGSPKTFNLAYEWYVKKMGRELYSREICNIMREATLYGCKEASLFLYQLLLAIEENTMGDEDDDITATIAEMIENTMMIAIRNDYEDLCILAHEWGACDYDYYLQIADEEDGARDEIDMEHVIARIRHHIEEWKSESA
jgi:hypothetical protein